MTRKDYELIAATIKEGVEEARSIKSPAQEAALRKTTSRLITRLKTDNPRFTADRFLAACGF